MPYAIKSLSLRPGEYLKGPCTPMQVQRQGYGMTPDLKKAWTFATEREANTKADILLRHFSASNPVQLQVVPAPSSPADRYLEMRKRFLLRSDVEVIMALKWESEKNRWVYLARAPRASVAPKYAVRAVDHSTGKDKPLAFSNSPRVAWMEWGTAIGERHIW